MTLRTPAPWAAGLAALIAVVTFAPAQPPRPAAPRDAVGPDDVRRVGEWLKGMQGGQDFDPALLKKALEFLEKDPAFAKQVEQFKKNPELVKQFEQFKKNNPNPSPQQLDQFAKQLGQNPALQGEQTQAGLKQFVEKLGGHIPSGGTIPQPPDIGKLGKNGVPESATLTPRPPPGGPGAETPLPNQPPVSPPTGPLGGTQSPSASQPSEGTPTVLPPKSPPPPPSPQGFPQPPQPGNAAGPGGFPKMPGGTGEQQQQYQKMAGWWEKNVGPLNDSPAVKQLMVDFATGSGSPSGQSGFGDLFGDGQGGQSALGKLADVNPGSSNWKLPDLGKPDFGWGSPPGMPDAAAPSVGSGPSLDGFGSGEGSWLPVVLLAAAAAAGLLLWWLWPRLVGDRSRGPRPLSGLGPWPVDPRSVADRAALVKAFEYLSVLRCGSGAKVWNHVTIAAELRRLIPELGGVADPLARLYAIARYTPADEPLDEADLAEAREHLCRIARGSP